MAENEYLVRIGDTDYLAESAEVLRTWASTGRIPRDAYVFEPGALQWRTAVEIEYLRAFFGQHFHVCRVCGYEGTPTIKSKLNGCVAVTLLVLLIVPGIIYLVWATSTASDQICPKCGGVNSMIPASSPVAAQLTRPSSQTTMASGETSFCATCGKYSPGKFAHCPHCGAAQT
jgi:hypothetical protein